MSPRRPLQQLQPDLLLARSVAPDLHCYEDMISPAELAALAAARREAVLPATPASRPADCFCLDDCPGPLCKFASGTRKRRAQAQALRTPSPQRRPRLEHSDDAWPQRVLIWHPGDFEASPVTMHAGAPLRAALAAFCGDLRVDRRHVRFVWQGPRPLALHDHDTPFDVGMREGRTEHIECEYK
jgi:hypothetical protein